MNVEHGEENVQI